MEERATGTAGGGDRGAALTSLTSARDPDQLPAPLPAPAGAGRAASREAIAHAFLSEYHRLLADALPPIVPESASAGASGAALRHRAFAWRVTAARIPLVPEHRWPGWLLDHLRAAGTTPISGAEYARQRELLVRLLGAGVPGELPPA